jgi:hypothetical protein
VCTRFRGSRPVAHGYLLWSAGGAGVALPPCPPSWCGPPSGGASGSSPVRPLRRGGRRAGLRLGCSRSGSGLRPGGSRSGPRLVWAYGWVVPGRARAYGRVVPGRARASAASACGGGSPPLPPGWGVCGGCLRQAADQVVGQCTSRLPRSERLRERLQSDRCNYSAGFTLAGGTTGATTWPSSLWRAARPVQLLGRGHSGRGHGRGVRRRRLRGRLHLLRGASACESGCRATGGSSWPGSLWLAGARVHLRGRVHSGVASSCASTWVGSLWRSEARCASTWPGSLLACGRQQRV